MSKCTSAVKQCSSLVVMAEQGVVAFRNCFICRMCSRPKTMRRGFRQLNSELWSFTFRIIFFFWILGKAPLELQASSAIEGTFCQGELFNWSSLSSDNSHVYVKSVFTSTWQRKYNYVMWLPRERGRAQGTRSPISTPHTELVME